MSRSNTELEVKFYLSNALALEARLVNVGWPQVQARVHEINLRFDTVDGEFTRSKRVLRLRQDLAARVTYKDSGDIQEGVHARQELEFTVSDFDTAKALFEALGYRVAVMYEKYRTTYKLDQIMVTLDELPLGDFVEIEGPDGRSIQEVALRLGLDWERRILVSYMELFDRARANMGFTFIDLSFANFKGLKVTAADLEVRPAD